MLLALLATICLLASGCGGGGDSSSGSDGDGSKGSAAEFLQSKSANNKFVEFGDEAPSDVRSEASEVLTKNLEAREAADFETQCATLSEEQVEQIGHAKGASAVEACTKELKKLAEPLSKSKSIRANELSGPITALRLKDDQAYALFHGKDKNNYAVSMRKEGTEWKVGAIVMTKLGKS